MHRVAAVCCVIRLHAVCLSGLFCSVDAHPITPIPVPPVVSKYLDEPTFTHEDTLSLAKMRSTVSEAQSHTAVGCGGVQQHGGVGGGLSPVKPP